MSPYPPTPAATPASPAVSGYSPRATDAAGLLPQLADGPVTVTRACTGCELRRCAPAECEDACRFLRLVEELQSLEERGLVRLWIHNLYSPRPDSRAMARVRLTDAGRELLLDASRERLPQR